MVSAQDITLPAPHKSGGKPLMEALNERQSVRAFTGDRLTSAAAIRPSVGSLGNKPPGLTDKGQPLHHITARRWMFMLPWKPDFISMTPQENILKQIHNRDIRALTGTQDFPATAPVNLVYVSDMTKRGKKEGDTITDTDLLSSWANTGFMAQNVYLYCASEGLGCVIRAMVPRDRLAPEMGLKSTQIIILAQSVGVPQK